MGTEMVPGTFGNRKGAWAHIGKERVPGRTWEPEWCPGTFGHRKVAQVHIGTEMVPGPVWALERYIWAPEESLGTYGH